MKKIITAVALLTACSTASAGIISAQTDFSDVSAWQLNGTAAQSGNRLALTTTTSQSGTAFLQQGINLNNDVSFSAFFTFEISNPSGSVDNDGQVGADGLAFVVQTNSNNVGTSGGGIGYQGIQNSVTVEFDTWDNGSWDDNNGNHVGINIGGNIDSVVQQAESTLFNTGGIWSVWVDYNGVTDLLEVFWSDTGTRSQTAGLSYTVDLTSELGGAPAFFGFTSGTGSAGGLHEILSYEFRDDFSPVVETNAPATLGMLAAISGLFFARRRFQK